MANPYRRITVGSRTPEASWGLPCRVGAASERRLQRRAAIARRPIAPVAQSRETRRRRAGATVARAATCACASSRRAWSMATAGSVRRRGMPALAYRPHPSSAASGDTSTSSAQSAPRRSSSAQRYCSHHGRACAARWTPGHWQAADVEQPGSQGRGAAQRDWSLRSPAGAPSIPPAEPIYVQHSAWPYCGSQALAGPACPCRSNSFHNRGHLTKAWNSGSEQHLSEPSAAWNDGACP